MKTSLTVFAAVIGFIMLTGVAACAGLTSNDETIRYKMTVTIETPEGENSSAVVREARCSYEKSILPDQGGNLSDVVKGEAVIVKFPSNEPVFGVISESGSEARFICSHRKIDKSASLQLPRHAFPNFVRFKNLQDPNTVEAIPYFDKKSVPSNLIFTPGVRVISVQINFTNEPISWEIDGYLPWLKQVKMSYLSGKQTARGAPLGLQGGNFQRGENK